MLKVENVAIGIRVKLNSDFKPKNENDENLKKEDIIFISDNKCYKDDKGEFVNIMCDSLLISSYAYLNELELEFN